MLHVVHLTCDIFKALQLALRVRQYSPRLEMFRPIAQESFNNNFNRNFEEKQNLKCCWADSALRDL